MTADGAAGLKAIAACQRCGAWARSAGRPCRHPVVRGKTRCHWHGGRNPGPPTGSQNALITGRYTRAAEAAKREPAAAGKHARAPGQEAKEAADAALRAA